LQARNFNHATQDLYDAIARGDYPEWEFLVQIMSDDAHPELDFDPLDDTKLWPPEQFPWLPIGRMVLDRNPVNYFAEVEQAAFGTGVLVDGLDFSDDKMLQGRTLSYSDTQRYRVGPNYLQLPINAPKKHVATNQRDGQMTYHVDLAPGQNPHINYEPSSLGGLQEAPRSGKDHTPQLEGQLVRQTIERTNDYKQAGERYRAFEDWERDDLVLNLVNTLKPAARHIQERMVWHFTQCDPDYGQRVAEGLELNAHASSSASGNGQNGHGSTIGTDAASANAAAHDAAEQGHPAKPY
ncbi:MAG: catalase, partial [Chloroflexales bacterium]|nr:catalase [Chloroflexales bacterium]